jgi:hypothetical protein
VQLQAGTYTMRLNPLSHGSGALFLVEIGSGQQSVLPLGALQLVSRAAPYEFAISDDAASREVATDYDIPKQPVMLPEGHYTIFERQSGGDWQVVQRGVEVQQNTIMQVAL